MKKRFLLIGLIFALATFTSRAQIYEMFSQNFETGSPVNYTLSSTSAAQVQTAVVSGGSRALKMVHSQSGEVSIDLDEIDFSQNSTLNYFTLEFMHMCYVNPLKCVSSSDVCQIYVKRPDQATWTQLSSTHYNMTEGGSVEFQSMASFSMMSYNEWAGLPRDPTASTNPSNNTLNSMWKAERFDLEQLFLGVVDPTMRKLSIRFVIPARTAATSFQAWYIDDIRVRASNQMIITPKVTMRSFPDVLNYPSSRGAKIVLDARTTAPQGINGDSVFVQYRVGNRTHMDTAYLHRVPGVANRFEGRIPFFGYDTLIHYHVLVKDSTVNHNTAFYPKNASQWITYRCVRGKTNTGQMTGTQTNSNVFPFPSLADNRSEFVYDSAMMAELGFGPGYITDFRFILTAQPTLVTRPHLQFRFANAPGDYMRSSTMFTYTSGDMQIPYDGPFTLEVASAGSYKAVSLQDTFFYAGGDIIMQVFYDGGSSDPMSTSIKHVPVATNKMSVYTDLAEGFLSYDAFGSNLSNFEDGMTANTRPWIQFFETKNVPLVFDCGVSALAYPNYNTSCNTGTDSVVLWLKNYGVSDIDSVDLFYTIDNGAPVHYVWTSATPLQSGDSVRVLVNSSQNFTVGYHTIRAWVADTLRAVTQGRFRDHEPYNDTCFTQFAACQGPYNGTRTVGTGSGAHFSSLEKCLYVLSRCGVNGPLTIKLPAGVYDVTTFPYIPGTSAANYVQFEPATATANVVFRRARLGDNNNVASLVDLSNSRSIRFKNIKFSNGRNTDNRCNVLVQLGQNSSNCQFLNCSFVDSNNVTNAAQALLRVQDADSVLVDGCSFYGGTIGVDVSGPAPDIRATRNVVRFNNFTDQMNTGIRFVNQNSGVVDSNFVNDAQTNSSYLILGQYCYDGTRITRNRVFSSKGSCCLGVSDMHGTSSNYCLVANNMIVSADDGSSNLLTTPLNIIKGSYIKVVFNSVRMNAPERVNIAAATLGGDIVSNCYFQNNVIATFDTSNYAFSFIPGDNAATLHVDHNCYYSVSGVLNKLSGANYTNLNNWRNAVPTDLGSVSGNPNYTNSSISRVDLRSFNSMLRNVGTPIPEVTIDLFGTTRNAVPSLGAYEVAALSIDFKPIGFVTPMEVYCGAPQSIPVEPLICNTGNGNYTYSAAHPITVYYSIDNGPVQSFIVNQNFGPNDTLSFLSTRTMSLPSGASNTDRTYSIKWWVKCNLDPNDLNDTNIWVVDSRYAAPAPTVINMNVNYNTAATITPSAGVNTWPVSYYTSGNGRQQRSGISWYRDNSDTTKFYYGPTLTTAPLFDDTTFYISQKRNLPLVKITEVQVSRTAAGATTPMPSWLNSSTFAVELTNCGDYPANLEGDSVLVVQSNAAAKIWVLPNVTVQPGESLVLQFRTSTTATDSSRTICAPSAAAVSPAYTANFGVIYRDGHGIADAVAFNGVITATSTQAINWNNQSVPTSVWAGTAIDLARNGGTTNTPTAGARRIAWPTNAITASPTATSTLWQVATATNPMQLGETESNLIRYFDNGCEGARAAVNIHITNRPTCDLYVEEVTMDTGCNLSSAEPVHATVSNYGANAVPTVILNYSLDGGATIACTDTLVSSLAPLSTTVHTFSRTVDMHAAVDTTFNVKVWVVAVSGDNDRNNDTASGSFTSRYTPTLPNVPSPLSVDYGNTLTINATTDTTKQSVAWFDAHHNPLGVTPSSLVTPVIYHQDTFFYKAVALIDDASTHVGTLATVASNNYPSPYNPKTRYVKEQYIFTADQIRAAGHEAGTISSLSFYLESLGNNVNSFEYSYYTIKMGPVDAASFGGTAFLASPAQTVFDATNLTFTAENIGWVKHTLDVPYIWNGTSNILIEITRALSTAGISAGANTRYTTQANTVLTKQHATTDQSTATTGATRNGNRPDILFGFLEPMGCESAEGMTLVNVTGVPDYDATIEWADLSNEFTSCDTTVMEVILHNMGNNSISNINLRYKIDNGAWQQHTENANNLPLGYSRTLPLLAEHLTPGRHTITAQVQLAGDTITSNDLITRTINVRFCAGEYSIGSCTIPDAIAHFPNISTAIDTLLNAGVAGPVIFNLCPQTYNEQLSIGQVAGVNDTNTITFRTVPGAPDMAKITYVPTNAANYVMDVNGANYITFDSLFFYANYTSGTGNNIFANVVKVSDASHIAFRNSVLRSKSTTASSTNANVVILGNYNHYITFDRCLIDSGYYGVRTMSNDASDNITINNSDILGFWYQGIYLRNCDTVSIVGDSIHAGVTVAGKPLTGIYLANIFHANVQRNFIYLIDNATGGKRGIVLNRCRGTNLDRVNVYNNMISLNGTGVASATPSGIYIDSLSRYMNVYFNTARLYAGLNQAATRSFSVQNSFGVNILNNIFDNQSRGYASYVAADSCVQNCNYNVYFSNCPPHATTGARKFVRWFNSDCTDLDSLRVISGKDPRSFEEEIYYINEPDDLRLRLAQFADRAQYNPDVTLDVYGHIRPQIPQPTIGAYEFNHRRVTHDVAVGTIIDPHMPTTTTGANAEVLNIETDSINVTAMLFNNGNASESNITWYAYIAGTSPLVCSETRTIARLNAQESFIDSVKVHSPLGIQDTQRIVVVVELHQVADIDTSDNRDTANFFIYPAYDLQVNLPSLSAGVDPNHCRMYHVPFDLSIINAGKKDFPGDFPFSMGIEWYCYQPANASFPNFPGVCSSDNYTLGTVLPVGTQTLVHLDSVCWPNLYPTGTLQDITSRIRMFVHYEYDIKTHNDTTTWMNVTSNHTPEAPVPHDTLLSYGSYGNLWATQGESRVIRWSRDTVNDASIFYNGNNNYNRSTHWSSTPQYFHDSLYYLSAVSNKNCTSYYSQINVGINPPLNYDVSISEVLSPRASGRVYLEKDTVKLRVVNYGSQPISNIPITFQWMNANGRTVYLEVTDTVRATIPGRVGDNVQHFDFEFDTALLNINQPLSNVTYTLNAWVNHPLDQERHNDTLRTLHTFRALAESKYDTINYVIPSSVEGFDISYVSFNELDNIMPDLIGYDNLWLGSYTAANAEIPTLRIMPGMKDTISIEVANNMDESDTSTEASLFVLIDYNRDGKFNFDNDENLTKTNFAKGWKVKSRQVRRLEYTVPAADTSHQFGYMRMAVIVDGDATAYINGPGNTHTNGQMQQYLLYNSPASTLDSVDAALTRVAYPRNPIVTDTDHFVHVMLANNGSQPLFAATIDYSFADGLHIAQSGTINWTGNLQPGESACVKLDSINFYEGTTNLTATVTVPGDTIHTDNNVLHYRYHRYYVVEARFIDSFDQAIDKWYVPAGYNNFTRNYFERNTPTKNNIATAYSQPNAYVTSASQTIATGRRGNRSVLYSPLISIRQIRTDTITFLLSKDMAEGSFLRLEYLDFDHIWHIVDDPSVRWQISGEGSWLDDERGWTGSSNGAYVPLSFSTDLISGEFGPTIQFRFVFTTPTTTSPNATFGDGAAIDNFYLGRARRNVDLGVTRITYPTDPQFGQTIHPRVMITNFGRDSISNFPIAFLPYGVYLPHEEICPFGIAGGDSLEYEFRSSFTVTNNFPDTFQICAFTRVQADIYDDNDSTCSLFGLSPLANDLYLYDILSPGRSAVAGDSLNITLRLRNFGQNEIDECDVHFIYNGGEVVTEHVNFADYLDRNLGSTEFFNYTFRHRVRATLGTMQIVAWCTYRYDTYPYNDTISRDIAGVSSVVDVQATGAFVDERANDPVLGIVLDNVGGRVANDFTVGVWYDNDTSTRFEETFHREHGFASGAHAVHMFSLPLQRRSAPWEHVTVYCTAPGDTNRLNDTSTIIMPYFTEISLDYIEIEENRTDSCRVRVVMTNHGTIAYVTTMTVDVNIQGSPRMRRALEREEFIIQPGETRHLEMKNGSRWSKIPKDRNRNYTGRASLTVVMSDADESNNQTTNIVVVNYFESIDSIANDGFVLEQNKPNPVVSATDIDFVIPMGGNVHFFVTDMLGRVVYDQVKRYDEGRHTINFDRNNLSAGVYYYGIELDEHRLMRKMIIR